MESRLASFTLVAALSGCASIQIQVPVAPRPALDLTSSPQVAVEPLQGDQDGSLRELIRATLATSHRFRVVAPEEARQSPTAVLFGSASLETREEVKSFDLKEGDFSTGERIVHHFLTRTATGTVHASLQARESPSGKPLGSRLFEVSSVEVKRAAPDLQPDLIAPGEIAGQARAKFAAELLQAVAPPPQLVEVTLFRDSKAPQLQSGISLASAGRLEEAAAAFADALQAAGKSGDRRLQGMAHWNRAILEELQGAFEAARQDVQQAASGMAYAQLTAELQHINELEQQARVVSAPTP
jgi:hypothetical protein